MDPKELENVMDVHADTPPAGEDAVKTKEITLETVLGIWWSFIWRWTVVAMVVGGLLGGIGGFIVAAWGSPEISGAIGALLGWLASIPVSIWALRAALRKKRDGYVVVLGRRVLP